MGRVGWDFVVILPLTQGLSVCYLTLCEFKMGACKNAFVAKFTASALSYNGKPSIA